MIALRNLLRSKVRTALTIAGAAVGIAVYVSLAMISNGFREQIEEVIGRYNIDVTIQSGSASTPLSSRISLDEFQRLRGIDGAREVSSLVLGTIKTPWNPYVLVLGISSAESLAGKVGLLEGRFPARGKGEVLIGDLVSRKLQYHVNNKILLTGNELLRVSGVFAGESNFMAGSLLFDIEDARRVLGRHDSVNLAFVQVRKGVDPRAVAQRINEGFPTLNATWSGDFAGQTRLVTIVETVTWAISAIAVLAGCIVVMNTLLMALSERTNEIGVLMAIGWSRFMIMRNIVAEALIVCFVSSVAGNLLGLLQVRIFNYLNPAGIGWWTSVEWNAAILVKSVGIALLMGLASSLYPALHATRLMPAEALRHE